MTAGDIVHCEKNVAMKLNHLNLLFSYIYIMRRKCFRTKLQKYSYFWVYIVDEKEYDIQVQNLFILIFGMLVVFYRHVSLLKGDLCSSGILGNVKW
jgi:hypothetical protein